MEAKDGEDGKGGGGQGGIIYGKCVGMDPLGRGCIFNFLQHTFF